MPSINVNSKVSQNSVSKFKSKFHCLSVRKPEKELKEISYINELLINFYLTDGFCLHGNFFWHYLRKSCLCKG